MKKVVLKLELHDDQAKQKAMERVSGLTGVDSIANDMKDKKLTVTGDMDPVTIVLKLRKICHTEIVTVGPAKEPEKKKEEPKKNDKKKNKVVLKLDLYDGAPICTLRSVFGPILTFDKAKQKAMKKVSGLTGVDSMEDMDMKDKKLTVTGDIDPVTLVLKLRKICHTEIVTVGPAKEPEKKKEEPKKKEPKKDDKKKEEPKKDEAKKDDKMKHEPKKDEAKKDDKKKEEPKKDEAKKDDKKKHEPKKDEAKKDDKKKEEPKKDEAKKDDKNKKRR